MRIPSPVDSRRAPPCPARTLGAVRWERFFEDLEDQLDSEWEAERAALDTEAERLRLAQVGMRERLVALAVRPRPIALDLLGDNVVRGAVTRVGADWCALTPEHPGSGVVVVPLAAIAGVAAPVDALLASVRGADAGSALAQRMGFGFVLRDLVRRRIPVRLSTTDGRALAGTIDRAGADHLDIALHEPGSPRRADNVTGFRLVPFAAVRSVRLDPDADLV